MNDEQIINAIQKRLPQVIEVAYSGGDTSPLTAAEVRELMALHMKATMRESRFVRNTWLKLSRADQERLLVAALPDGLLYQPDEAGDEIEN